MNKIFHRCIALIVLACVLCGCGVYSSEEVQRIKEDAYREGYEAGYDHGAEDQLELIIDEYVVDGRSIGDIEKSVYRKFGVTPHQAFQIFDEYTYDGASSGYTWSDYQVALEAMYYTASIFPRSE